MAVAPSRRELLGCPGEQLPVTDTTLPASTPSVQGVEAEGVQALLDALEGTPGIEPHGLMVLRHGFVVAAGWWSPYSPARPHLLYSASKSFTSTAAGLAVAEGLLDLDRPVVSYFPELDAEVTDPRSRSMLVRHIASMASGHVEETWDRVMATHPAEPVLAFLRIPPDRDPGTVFAYNQSCTYTLGAIVQRLTGETLASYLKRKLPGPLGASELCWAKDHLGRDLGFSGLHATTETLARLGLLYLRNGEWGGEQVLPPGWVAEATREHISTASAATGAGIDWRQGYGYQFWQSRHGYRGDGAYGQFSLVLPEYDAVVAITSQSTDMQAVLDAVWDNLLPALLDGPVTDTGADARLRDRLGQLALAAPVAEALPPAGGQQVWVDTTFAPEGGLCASQPSLKGVTVSTDLGGWRLALHEGGSSLWMKLGMGAWAQSDGPQPGSAPPGGDAVAASPVPVACAGGWVGPAALRFDVIFLETPHRLVVTCKIPDKTFEAHWVAAPLGTPPLSGLRAPR